MLPFLATVAIAFGLGLTQPAFAQVSVLTYHYDTSRSGLNSQETILTTADVNYQQFGKLYSYPVDGYVVAQPLYVPAVSIPGIGIRNVVYVATSHDSVFAFDADNTNGASVLWQTSFIDPANGVTSVPISVNGCSGIGLTEVGIMGTPVIDPTTNTLYVNVKTEETSGGTTNYVHRLHALDITTGAEKFGGPVVISAVAPGAPYMVFNSQHQNQRPALLLSNGVLYIAYGSNGCDMFAHGWVLAYDAATLQQLAVFNTSPNGIEASLWQSGDGLAADSSGNLFVMTANGSFDANTGGTEYGDSFLKLDYSNGSLNVSDYFTPYNQATLAAQDLDLGSGGVMLLPDQPGAYPHLVVGAGKTGDVYLVNRDSMGGYNSANNSQIVQWLPSAIGPFYSTAVSWNNMVYFAANTDAVKGFSLSNGLMSTTPAVMSLKYPVAGTPVISANGTTNGIFWFIRNPPTPILSALNATNLKEIYNSTQAGTRDSLGGTAHFISPTVANGKVFVATQTQLVVYGLFPNLAIGSGNNQTGTVGSALASPLTVRLYNPYSGAPISGVTVTFSDGGAGGTFSNPSGVTDPTGKVSTSYTLPTKSGNITITASSTSYGQVTFSEVAASGSPTAIAFINGGSQTGAAGTTLPTALTVLLKDAYGNGASGRQVTFSDGGAGGSFAANPVIAGTTGQASASYTLPTKAKTITVTATANSLTASVSEKSIAGPAAAVNIATGNNQSATAGSTLPTPLGVSVLDTYGNPVSGVTVAFSDGGAGGTFSSPNPATNVNGLANTRYTTPSQAGSISITATVSGATPATFTETAK
jgi:hypothetical protein